MSSAGSQKKLQISTANAPAAIGPYSQAVVSDGWVYCSGQIPLDPTNGQVVAGGVEIQAKRVLDNLKGVLIAAGASFDKVIKCTIFLKDMNDFAVVNEVYGEYFSAPFPARACVEVARLPKDVLVEIEAIARI